jgi:hypothetical protein
MLSLAHQDKRITKTSPPALTSQINGRCYKEDVAITLTTAPQDHPNMRFLYPARSLELEHHLCCWAKFTFFLNQQETFLYRPNRSGGFHDRLIKTAVHKDRLKKTTVRKTGSLLMTKITRTGWVEY